MWELLSNGINQFMIATIFTILGIVVTLYVYYRSKSIKALSFNIISYAPLFMITKEMDATDFEVYYKGNHVQNLYGVIVELKNTGNKEILETDFQKKLELKFEDESEKIEILSARIDFTEPDNMDAVIDFKNDKVWIEPLLINAGEIIRINTIVVGKAELIVKNIRIAGINEKHLRHYADHDYTLPLVLYIPTFMIIGYILGVGSALIARSHFGTYIYYLYDVITFLAFVIAAWIFDRLIKKFFISPK